MRTKNILNETLRDISIRLNVSKTSARQIKRLIKGDINPEAFRGVSDWANSCYNRPSLEELIHEALNAIVNGYGVEAIIVPDSYIDSFYMDINFLYINTGDTYQDTIIYDTKNDKYFINSIGNILE